MKLLEISYLHYKLKHRNGYEFIVRGTRLDDGRLIFDPVEGWNDCCENCQQDAESLLEDIDDVIYNATPEVFENE